MECRAATEYNEFKEFFNQAICTRCEQEYYVTYDPEKYKLCPDCKMKRNIQYKDELNTSGKDRL